MVREFFHGSTKFFTSLSPTTWVSSSQEDARIFAIPWGSNNFSDIKEIGSIPFKGFIPKDCPIFIYKIETDRVTPVEGGDGSWLTTDWAKVELVEYYPSWHKLFGISLLEIEKKF